MDFLFNYAKELQASLQKLNKQSFSTVQTLNLDCTVLPIMGKEGDCRLHLKLKHFFDPLDGIKSPALYWFEITSKHTAKDLLKIIPDLKQEIDRNVPVYKKGFSRWDSKVLYVGKVKSNITGRMVVHLGYYKNKNTQGLQLCHWSQEMKLRLRLHYIVLPNELSEMAGLFEKKLAAQLNPIFGKHK